MNSLLSNNIADKIGDMIFIEHRFGPGDKLPNEMQLAKELNVSRTSIREAVKLLSSAGVLSVQYGRGTFVTENPGVSPDPLGLSYYEDKEGIVNDWLEVRLILEPEAARLATERASDAEIAEIVRIAGNMDDVLTPDDAYRNEDTEFHSLIAKAAHNEVIKRFVPVIQKSIIYSHDDPLKSYPDFKTKNLHSSIARFIALRDGEGAKMAMRYHLLITVDLTKQAYLNK